MQIHFARPDGKETGGYLAMPNEGEHANGVVVIHEYWGVTDQIRGVADHLAKKGLRALAVDLFHGEVAEDPGKARQLAGRLDLVAAVEQEIRGAVRHLKERTPSAKVAVLGFCMGGRLAQAAAARVQEADAFVSFYGNPAMDVVDFSEVAKPILLHFARRDEHIPASKVEDAEAALRKGGAPYELHWYDADHAFANETRPEVYDAASARQAWERTDAFLERVLKKNRAQLR